MERSYALKLGGDLNFVGKGGLGTTTPPKPKKKRHFIHKLWVHIYICIIYIIYIIYYIHIINYIYIYIAKVWWTMPITRWHFGPGGMDYGSSPSHWNPGFKQPEFDRMGFVVFFVAGKMLQISYQWDFQTAHAESPIAQVLRIHFDHGLAMCGWIFFFNDWFF